ncbi:hypothetical protein [Marinimicrobium locisalis]|uniref:hypothetical protein n=1 Tax=Marinimicrobium locisalis TaxID=546022 RepID=UPI003221F7C7
MFVPNVADASPRIIAEALCLDVPILMNENILGGWKYITAMSGRFFSGEHDVLPCAEEIMSKRFHPRLAYMNSFGPRRAEQALAGLLKTLDPGIEERRPLQIEPSAS